MKRKAFQTRVSIGGPGRGGACKPKQRDGKVSREA